MKKYDAIVIGKGIAGLATALALAKKGKAVMILEKQGVRGAATPASAGILDPVLGLYPRSPLINLSMKAFRCYPESARQLTLQSRQSIDFSQPGMLYVAASSKDEKILRKSYLWQKRLGLRMRWIDGEKAKKLYPFLSKKIRGGILYPGIGRVRPAKLAKALDVLTRKKGVSKVTCKSDVALMISKGRVTGVKVDKKTYRSLKVVNATGCWSGCQRDKHLRAPVKPVRGQLMTVRGKIKIPIILHSVDGTYIVPWAREHYLIGSTIEKAGFQSKVTRQGIRKIQKGAEKIIAGIHRLKITKKWAGLRPFSKDRLPIIGASRIKGLYHATGYYRSGILIGLYVGELLAGMMESGKTPKILKPYSPRRFD